MTEPRGTPDDGSGQHPPAGRGNAAGPPRPAGALLRVPLFYKILIANAVLVLVGAIVGSTVTARAVRAEPGGSVAELAWLLGAAGVVLSVLVNAAILRIALSPLETLERTAGRVQAGDLDARAPVSPVADREMVRLTRTFNAMLDAAAAYRTRLREVAVRALGAAEEERKRVARELHDETAQMLAALLIRIRILRSSRDPQVLDDGLDQMRRDIGEALEGVRRFARGLRPPALDELGLVPAIESHVRALEEITGIDFRVQADDAGEALEPEAELAVYRIVQESLSNVVRHAGASRVTLRVEGGDGRLMVTIHDNGRGFSPAQVMEEGGGLGLFGMQERAAYLGGRVEVQSEPGEGTQVRAEIPTSGSAVGR